MSKKHQTHVGRRVLHPEGQVTRSFNLSEFWPLRPFCAGERENLDGLPYGYSIRPEDTQPGGIYVNQSDCIPYPGVWYRSTEQDREVIRTRYGDSDGPPPWEQIQADLVALGHPLAGLERLTARAIIALLRKLNPEGEKPDGAKGQCDDEERTEGPDGGQSPERAKLKPAWVAARGAYEWAMSRIPDAGEMTIKEVFDAIQNHPDMKADFLEKLPDNAETFAKYLRNAGVRRYDKTGRRRARTVRRRADL
jgi:hypothetical protein